MCIRDSSYVVRPGDFWLRLAREASVDVAVLYRANGANSATPLRSGATICLPAGVHVTLAATPKVTALAKVTVLAKVTAAHTTRTSH